MMSSFATFSRWACVLVILSPSVAQPQRLSETIDPSTGVVDGKKALGVWATGSVEGNVELLDSSNFTVHLTPFEDLDRELVFPCGEWFSPPPGSYLILLEGPDQVSPTAMSVRYGASPFDGRGIAVVHLVVPAGKVRVQTEDLPANTVARVMHLESHRQHAEFQKKALIRRASLAAIGEGVLMPTGAVIVALYDKISEEYVALSPPVRVEEGQAVLAEPAAPAAGESGVLAVIKRPRLVPRKQEDDVEVRWVGALDRPLAPDVLIRTSSRLVAIWYGLSGSGRVIADSPTVARQELAVDLTPGKIHRLEVTP